MRSAISPIRTADLHFVFHERRSGSNVNPLSLPPAIRTTGLVCASKRFLDRVEVGRLGIVDVIDAADVRAQIRSGAGAARRRKAAAPSAANDNPRARPTASVAIRFSMLCEPRSFVSASRRTGCVSINDRAFGEPKIASIGIGAEGDRARSNRRQVFRAALTTATSSVGLIFENAQLGRAIFGDRAIAIEMVGSEVEPDADRRTKGADRFELERAHFDRQHVERSAFRARLRKAVCRCCRRRWFADRRHSAFARAIPSSWSLPFVPVMAMTGTFAGAPTQLELADHVDIPREEKLRASGEIRIDART